MPLHMHGRYVLALLVSFVALESLCADETAQPADTANQLPVVELTLVPQPEPDPPLKYSLVPAYPDIKPGNAATWYYRAILLLPREKEKAYGEEQDEWLSLPLDQFPTDKAREFLRAYQNTLHETKTATFCEHCDWGLQLRDMKGMGRPELPASRNAGDPHHCSRVESQSETGDCRAAL